MLEIATVGATRTVNSADVRHHAPRRFFWAAGTGRVNSRRPINRVIVPHERSERRPLAVSLRTGNADQAKTVCRPRLEKKLKRTGLSCQGATCVFENDRNGDGGRELG